MKYYTLRQNFFKLKDKIFREFFPCSEREENIDHKFRPLTHDRFEDFVTVMIKWGVYELHAR